MKLQMNKNDKGDICFGTLLFDSGKKVVLNHEELEEFKARLILAKSEGNLHREIGTSGLEFTCPDCQSNIMECCEDGPYTSVILNIAEDGDFDYGKIYADGQVVRYQCLTCGYVLKGDKNIHGYRGIIDNNEDVVKWVRERMCSTCKGNRKCKLEVYQDCQYNPANKE